MLYSLLLAGAMAALQLILHSSAYTIPNPGSIMRRDSLNVTHPGIIPFPFEESDSPILENVFTAIVSMPDGIFNDGDDAANIWMAEHGYHSQSSPDLTTRQNFLQIANCAVKLALAVIPAAQAKIIFRMKDLIRLAGGEREVAKKLLRARSWPDLIRQGGSELQELANLLFGFQDVADACFNMF